MACEPECGRPDDREPDEDSDNEIITCWCGAIGTFQELFDSAVYGSGPCNGLGVLHCECGGDFCVCHNHGEVECPGCEECGRDDEDDGFDDYERDEDDPL